MMCHVYLVNVPSGRASRLTKPVVELGKRFFLLPMDIRCCMQSKNIWGAWKTSGSGLPAGGKGREGHTIRDRGKFTGNLLFLRKHI